MHSSVLVTGCSFGSGGNAIAKEYNTQGMCFYSSHLAGAETNDLLGLHVFATARRLEAMADLKGIPGITLVQLDVTSVDSIRHAKDEVAAVLGNGIGLDILVNNAGVMATFAALDQELTETRQMFETNLFGVMAMVQVFMPLLMLSPDASIVNVGSFTALIPFPFGSSYSATKAALHSYSDALRLELKPLGIKVTTVVQGGVMSNMAMQKLRPVPEASFYASIEAIFQKTRSLSPDKTITPETFARQFVNASLKNSPSRYLRLGTGATIVPWLAWLIPAFLMEYAISKAVGLDQLATLRSSAAKTK